MEQVARKEIQMKFKAKSVGEFPLRQSLFWMNDGNLDSTWCWLSRKFIPKAEKMFNKLIEYRSNTMLFAMYAPGGDFPVNLFKNDAHPDEVLAGAEVDMAEVERWKGLLALGNVPGINLIPTIFFGDNHEVAKNKAFLNFFLPAITQFVLPYSRAIVLACEGNRGMSVHDQADGINLIKGAMALSEKKIPVGVHMASPVFPAELPSEADFYAMEFPWHPIDEAENFSIEDGIKEAKRVIACSPVPVLFIEDDAYCESPRARGLSQELAKLDGCYCLPGPT